MNFKKFGFVLVGMLMYGVVFYVNVVLVDLELLFVIDVFGSVSIVEYIL